jgi:hypothetical protein
MSNPFSHRERTLEVQGDQRGWPLRTFLSDAGALEYGPTI